MAINNNIEDPKYRKKIYEFLSTNFADFKRTETDFYKKLDTDSNYADQVYDVISQNYSDFGRPRAEFLELMLPSKKKELSEPVSPVGGEAGTSAPPSGFEGLKPAKRQPTEVIKEPKVVGEDTLLARKMERAQRPAVATTEVKLPAAPKLVAEEKAAERALAPKLEPRVAKDEQGWLANTVSALDRGFYKNLIGNPIKGLATVVQYGTEAMTGGRVKEGPVSDALNKFGDWFNNAIDEVAPQDPEFKNSLSDQFVQALGQVGSIVLTGGFGAGGRATGIATQAVPSAGRLAPAVAAGKELVSEITSPAAISAGLTMGQAEFDRAKKAGASDDQAFEAFYKNAAVGSILEKIPVMQFFKRFNNATAGGVANYIKNKGVAGITGGLEEATTEVLQQVYANKTAKDIYNTNQDIFEGLTESGGIGFGVGFLLNAMGANAKILRKQGKEAEAQLVDAQIKEFESRAEKGPEVPPAPAVAPEMVQYTMEAPRLPGEPERISKPIELSIEPQVPAAEEKTYRVEYFDPESRKMTHQMFATEAEGEAFKKTLTREQASQGVTSYFEKAPTKGVGEVAPEAAPSYLQNVRQAEAEGFYKADFGRNGGLTWEIPESQREKDSPEYLIIQSIDRNKDTGEAPKEDSKGEGAKAIADLFNKYPSVNEIVYDDYSQSGFWQKIGGDNQSLKREDFFKYYNSKFPKEAAPEVPAAPRPEAPIPPSGFRPLEGFEEFEVVGPKKEAPETKEETDLRKRALNLDVEGNIRGEVLQYFIGNGTVSPEAIKRLFQRKDNNIRWNNMKPEERKTRIGFMKKGSPDIEALAEKLAGADRLDITQDFRNAIEDVLLGSGGKRDMAKELVESYDAEYKMMMRDRELAELGEEMERQVQEFTAGLPEAQKKEIIEVLDEFRFEDGSIDWARIERELEAVDPFSPEIILRLSPETQKTIQDGIKQIKDTGRVSRVPVETAPSPEALRGEARAAEATDKRTEAKNQLRDAFNDLMNLGVAYDPRSQAEKQVRLTKAIINVIKQEAIGAIKDLQKYIKDNIGFDISDVDAKYLLIESKKPEYAIQEPTAGEVPVQPEARVGEEVAAGVPPARPPKPPKEGEVEGETGAEKKSVELSLKGIKEIANEFSIEDVEGRTRKTDIELRENAKDKIDKWVAEGSYDKNIDNLVKKAEDFDVLTDEQRIILEQHLANVRENFSNGIENGTIKAGSEEFTNGLNQIKRLLDAASKTRSAAGAALRIPIGGSVAHPLENYDTALVAKMDANSVDKLTDAQIKEVEESVRLYKEKIDAANERIKDLEDKLSQMMAEEEVSSVKKRKKAIKSKEERVAERKQAIADAREALKKIRTGEAGLSAVPIPFVREFVAISPYVKKIAQSYIEEGVDNLNLLIDKIYEDFKDDLPEMTKKDVRDIIGNQYSQRKETATEAKSKLRDLTEEARLLSLYEKLLSGEEPVSERKKVERNQRIVELRDKINEIRRRNKEQDVDYKDLKRIEDTKNRALQKAKEYKKKLDEKDFAPSEKPISIFNDTKLQKKYPKEYNEMLDAIQEREDAKHEFDIELMKDEERRQTKLQKIGRYAKMFTGTTKAIKSGIDASATLIQNFAMLSAYPKSFAKAFVNQWGDFASQKKFNRWHTAIKNNKPVWDLIQNSGLSITEPSALKEAQKEEIFSDNLLDRTFKIGDKTYNIGKYTTKPFERLFVSMGNALRVDVFLRIADKWYVEGKTFETNPEDYKSLANMLNNMTSRAKLAPAVERARDIVGTGIWSPQLMASRLNLLGISDAAMPFFGRKGYYAGLTPKVRKMQVANMAKMIGLGLSIMLLAKVSGSDDDEGDLDPVSPTFGTVKIGEKRIPVWSNYPKYIRTIAQFASGKQKIEGEYADKRRGETAQRFFRSSVPPATGTAIDIITGRDYMGKPITKEGIVKGLVMPMSLEAISKEVQRDGVLGAVTGAAQFFGLNVSDERDYVKKDDRPFDIKDPVTFKKREVTEKELEAFKKRRDEIYKELVDDYENGRKTIYLNPEDKIKLSIPSSVSDMELDSWRELYYEKLTPEQIKELYKLLMSRAKKDSKNELKLTLGEEEEKED